MKLAGYKRIYENDFNEEERSLVSKLASSLNIGIENVYLALNNRISLQDNIQGTFRQINVTVNAQGIPQDTVGFQLDKQGGTQVVPNVVGVDILRAENLVDDSVFVEGAPFMTFTQNNEYLQIQHISGLPAGYTFRLTLMAFN
jgi:hypothetical protein